LTLLELKFQTGLRNGRQFWRELQAKGFTGSYERVHDWVRFRRDQELFSVNQKNKAKVESDVNNDQKVQESTFQLEKVGGFAARQLVWLLLLPFEKLTEDDQKVLKALQDTIPSLVKARELAGVFKQIVDSKITTRRKPILEDDLIHHSDRGVQYASLEFKKALAKLKATSSMLRKGIAGIML
jgi:hypothetical protein